MYALATGQPLASLYDLEMDDLAALEEALRLRSEPPRSNDINDFMRMFNG